MFKRIFSLAVALALVVLAPPSANAKAPQSFTGEVVRVADGDTYIVKRDDGSEVKVRLHYADCPEISHKPTEVDQPAGREALAAASELLLEAKVTVTVHGVSYGRLVGDVTCSVGDVALLLTRDGHAMLDTRYKPTKVLVDAQADAKAHHRGLWADDNPTPPWEWRQQQSDKIIIERRK